MKPEAAEYEAVNAQLANLKQIAAGDDWWTDLGAGAGLVPIADQDPALSCWPSDVSTNTDGESGAGIVSITWTAVVPLAGIDSMDALLVLADMRAALVSSCGMSDPIESGATMTLREPGSNYATVTITVVSQMISDGRA